MGVEEFGKQGTPINQGTLMDIALVLFRRDLRLHDNTALLQAAQTGVPLLPLFILDPRQVKEHPYFSRNALQILFEGLEDLNDQLQAHGGKLHLCYGEPREVIRGIVSSVAFSSLYLNRDYTPYSKTRDEEIANICQEYEVSYHSCSDLLLNDPEAIRTTTGTPYTVYGAFARRSQSYGVREPTPFAGAQFTEKELPSLFPIERLNELLGVRRSLAVGGGRTAALAQLKVAKGLERYKEERDIPALAGTTKLSAHHKFGTLSIREVYTEALESLGPDNQLLKELYWRDFFTHIAFHFPHIFNGAFHQKYDDLEWRMSEEDFDRWSSGTTGFPIVDAGMRELNETGFMHNRVRMITASFLVKDLHISWREGERHFARHLLDYDPSVNNGNWQWVASTGCDAQPYFRIFNPWLQQKRFDPECLYIKQWIPELSHLSAAEIHKLDKRRGIGSYPAPMVDHGREKEIAERMFSVLR